MKKKLLRNSVWILLIAVWSFLGGAYVHLGWGRSHQSGFLMGFILGGIATWIVFSVIGILIYRFTKKNGTKDPSKIALGVLSFFTICFLLIGWVRYDDVQKDKFVEDTEYSFILHYTDKAQAQGLKIDNLNWELHGVYSGIRFDLRRDPQLEELMRQKSADAVFEDNRLIPELCLHYLETAQESDFPPPAGLPELFRIEK